MSQPAAPTPPPSFSFGRVFMLAVPLALVIWGANKMYSGSVKQEQQEVEARGRRNSFVGLLGDPDEAATLSADYKDADGDLVADAPADDKCLDPDVLMFSYVASSDSDDDQDTWKELLAAIGASTGKEVELVSYADNAEQMRALERGDLHVTAFSTGETPVAVNEAGFVPLACFADADGKYHYTMKIIVPADSPVQSVDDLKNGRVTFVRPRSHSGCTAALVMLMKEHDLQPERDYSWGFSYGHEDSIQGVAAKRYQAAAVASDILERMKASGEVSAEAIREIYESEPFPPGVVGYAYNLTPQLRDAIRKTILEFDWAGTGLETTYGSTGAVKFSPVVYKADWEPVREIRQVGGTLLAELGGK